MDFRASKFDNSERRGWGGGRAHASSPAYFGAPLVV